MSAAILTTKDPPEEYPIGKTGTWHRIRYNIHQLGGTTTAFVYFAGAGVLTQMEILQKNGRIEYEVVDQRPAPISLTTLREHKIIPEHDTVQWPIRCLNSEAASVLMRLWEQGT